MAKSEHLTIIERVAQLCFAVNLRIQAEFSQFQLEEVELRDDGSLELIRAFHQGESALEEFDEAQMLKDFEEKHRNAALMYRHCTFSVMFFGRFVEEVLKDLFTDEEEVGVRGRAFALPAASCQFEVSGRLRAGSRDRSPVAATECNHEVLSVTIGDDEFVIDLSIAQYGYAKCGYTRAEYDTQMNPEEEVENGIGRLEEELEEELHRQLKEEMLGQFEEMAGRGLSKALKTGEGFDVWKALFEAALGGLMAKHLAEVLKDLLNAEDDSTDAERSSKAKQNTLLRDAKTEPSTSSDTVPERQGTTIRS